MSTQMQADASGGTIAGHGLDWPGLFATRAERMKASEIRELLKLLDQPDVISFAGGIPDPALFPAEAFGAALSAALSGDSKGAALQYSVSEGYKPLRDWLVSRMASLGVECTADNIMITSGSQQALDYLGKLFLSKGDTALVGWPTYLGALQAFNAYEPSYDRLTRSATDRPPTTAKPLRPMAARSSSPMPRPISPTPPARRCPRVRATTFSIWPPSSTSR
jgi:DNA-binding transcriptional MocR family regulator